MDEPELKIINVFICKRRKKLANASNGKNYIETVWGRGYVLREPTEEEAKIPACRSGETGTMKIPPRDGVFICASERNRQKKIAQRPPFSTARRGTGLATGCTGV